MCILAAALLAAGIAGPATAADAVKIGAIYPLTCNAASAGAFAERLEADYSGGSDFCNRDWITMAV